MIVSRGLSIVGAIVLALTASVASADWLVTRDGNRIETQGAWEVKGRQVIFTLPNGTLSSMRTDEVDLEASASATAEALEPPAPPAEEAEPEERKPVMVLTNADVRKGRAPATVGNTGNVATGGQDGGGAEPGQTTGNAPAAAAAGGDDDRDVEIQLLTWKAQPSDTVSGLELVGTLRNVGTDPAAKVEVGVTISDDKGETIFETNAFIRSQGLAPGRHTNFRALLPNIHQLAADPVFDVRAVFVVSGDDVPAQNQTP